MALYVESRVMSPELIRHALARRFNEAERYSDFSFIFNALQDFVIWCALPCGTNAEFSPESICRAQLKLVGLEHLFV
jgi:hypothetical protein